MDEATKATILRDAIEQILEDLDAYCDNHDGDCPVRDETVRKLAAALRLLEEEVER